MVYNVMNIVGLIYFKNIDNHGFNLF